MTIDIAIHRLRWTTQHISDAHLEADVQNDEPILVSQLNDGNWFVHDGRHRTIRAENAGKTHIRAEILK